MFLFERLKELEIGESLIAFEHEIPPGLDVDIQNLEREFNIYINEAKLYCINQDSETLEEFLASLFTRISPANKKIESTEVKKEIKKDLDSLINRFKLEMERIEDNTKKIDCTIKTLIAEKRELTVMLRSAATAIYTFTEKWSKRNANLS
jgi:hypothetical protein